MKIIPFDFHIQLQQGSEYPAISVQQRVGNVVDHSLYQGISYSTLPSASDKMMAYFLC